MVLNFWRFHYYEMLLILFTIVYDILMNALCFSIDFQSPDPENVPENVIRSSENRKPKTELRFCHFRQKNGPGTSGDRKPKAESRKLGLARGAGARRPKTENRITSLPFSPKKWSGYLRRPKAEGRIPKAWPGPARGAGARRPKTENRIAFLPFSPKKRYLRRPKAEGRIPKAWPGPRGRGPKTENRKPNYVFVIFAKKLVRVPPKPPKTESRRPNPESLARPGPRGRGPKTENRITFLPFSQKKMVRVPPKTESRRPNPESLARPGGQGPEDRKPNYVFVIFAKKISPGTSETSEDRKPKAESRKLGPARPGGAGARRPKTENRITFFPFSHKKMVRVPPKTESRRPNPESLARPGGRGPKTENRAPKTVFT